MIPTYWEILEEGQQNTLKLSGDWRMSTIASIARISPKIIGKLAVDGEQLTSLDTAGAMHLIEVITEGSSLEPSFVNFSEPHKAIIELVKERILPASAAPSKQQSVLQRIGQGAIELFETVIATLDFLGRTLVSACEEITSPARFRLRETFVHLETTCVNAIPIVALVTGLIGIVIAYLYASQMQRYGANIFIVDGLALAMCRELSPIITAILVAGRSGSAFTAQIGTMKINEEVDALVTLGLSPMHVLVIPRVLALTIALPILVFVGDVVGIFAGGLIANWYLGIGPVTFVERLDMVMKLKTLLVGLLKAPIFAIFIGIIACRMGLNVENNARSVGLHTTSTVVQSIVCVILLNAFIAVLLVELKI